MRKDRAGTNVEQALELFLDTISNAFGGIIFVALLVCVLLRFAGAPVRQSVDTKALQEQLRSLPSDVAALQQVRHAQQNYRIRFR